jgi:uncharacterized membrane protein (DUF485 family)
MYKKLSGKIKFIFGELEQFLESIFVGEKTFNAEYMITSTIQIVLVVSFIVMAEFAKKHIGEHVSRNDLSNIKIAMTVFEFYMYFLILIIFMQSTMLLYKKSRNIFFTLLYDMYYLLFIAIGGAVIFLLKT